MTNMEKNINNQQQYKATELLIYCYVGDKLVQLKGKTLVLSSKSLQIAVFVVKIHQAIHLTFVPFSVCIIL